MLKQIIKHNLKGKFFSVEFTKKDGTLRKLHGRLGVTKHLKGGKKGYDISNLLTVFDMQIKQYRTVNLNKVQKLTCGDLQYRK